MNRFMHKLRAYSPAGLLTFTPGLLLLATSLSALAEVVPPVPRAASLELSFDKATLPAQNVQIWKTESGGYDTGDKTEGGLYAKNTWLCLSSTDPAHGQCATASERNDSAADTIIPLTFTEKRSGMRTILNVTASRDVGLHYPDLSNCIQAHGNRYVINTPTRLKYPGSCGYDGDLMSNETFLSAYLPAAELKKLPVGGIWEADLDLMVNQEGDIPLVEWTAHLSLKMTDTGHIDIYFPAFASTSPRVQLNLNPHGGPDGNAWASDYTVLDMCLYDGYNVNSDRYEVTFRQEASGGRTDGMFSLYREGDETASGAQRIDFHLKLKSPTGDILAVENAKTLSFDQINIDTIRPVRIPSIPYAVLCAPMPLIFVVDKFDIKNKIAGFYRGSITVEFTPFILTL